MRTIPGRLVDFFRELRQRRVYHTTAIYVAAAFVILQAADLLITGLHLPDWVLTLLIMLALVGLPVAVVLSWTFDLTPAGIRRAGSTADTGLPMNSRARLVLAAAILVLAGGAGVAAFMRVGRPPFGAEVAPSVAVLPFVDFGANPEDEYLSDGLTEDVLTQLAKAGGLRVISRTSVMQYKGTRRRVSEIGSELGVTHVLEGSVRRTGDRLRVTAQLIDTRTDAHVWAETYDRTVSDVFEVESDLAQRIARALRVQLTSAERERITAAPTTNPAAYDLFLRARQQLYRFDREANEVAIDLARKALAIDPEFAPAYALLGSAFAFKVRVGAGTEWADSGMIAAQRAVTLDPELADGHLARGNAYLRLGRYAEALNSYERAAQLNPSDWRALANTAVVHSYEGRPVEALRWTRRAIAIDPRSPLVGVAYQNLAAYYLDLSLPDRAEAAIRMALETQPADHPQILTYQISIALQRGDLVRARAGADILAAVAPTDPSAQLAAGDAYLFSRDVEHARMLYQRGYTLSREAEGVRHFAPALLGSVLWLQGETGRAQELFAEMEKIGQQEISSGHENYSVYMSLAAINAARGNADAAFRHLRKAVASAGVVVEWSIGSDPLLDPIRKEPRFLQLRAGLRARGDAMRRQVLSEEL